MPRRIALNLNFDPELVQALDAFVASQPGENRRSIARKAVGEYLRRRTSKREEEPDALDLEMAREAKRRMEDPTDEVIPYAQARAELGLA